MITYHPNEDILMSNAELICIPVNTEGVMGKGLALQFKERYPIIFGLYKEAYKRKAIVTGQVTIFQRWVMFPTKQLWRNPSQYSWIREGLEDLYTEASLREKKSIAIPPLGCGLGGLEWSQVCRLIRNEAMLYPETHTQIYGEKQ